MTFEGIKSFSLKGKKYFSLPKKSRGISLLEVLLSLTIIAIILVMATRYFFLASNDNRVNNTRQEIGAIIAAVRGWKDAQYDYQGLSYTALYNRAYLNKTSNMDVSGVFPNAQVNGIYDPWGDPIVLSTGVTASSIKISVDLPNNSDCLKLQNSYPTATCGGGANNSQFELYIEQYLG